MSQEFVSKPSTQVNRVLTEQVFEAPVTHLVPQTKFVGKLTASDATPSVENMDVLQCGGATVTVTNFDRGQDGQVIRLLGDGFTTIQHGTKIKTNTAADKLLAANKVYVFTRINTVWYEDA